MCVTIDAETIRETRKMAAAIDGVAANLRKIDQLYLPDDLGVLADVIQYTCSLADQLIGYYQKQWDQINGGSDD